MGCDDVRRAIYFFLDGSLADDRRSELTQHITRCADCETRLEFHRRVRQFIRRRLTPVEAPSHLKVRLSRSIRAFATDI
ncbi:MAG TPA: zf-HC2 domain-containing protein [Thermoanaerobaculia bacterium]|nr:zf-HC2 domain-containing protein [Thermoanaerobaculia bacterium]